MDKKENILNEIRRISTKLGRQSITQQEFKKYSTISLSRVRYHFGTWNNAATGAGLIPIESGKPLNPKKSLNDSVLLDELIKLSKEIGKEPTLSILNSKGKYSVRPYIKRWGTLHKAYLIAKKNIENVDLHINEKVKKQIQFIPDTIKPKETKLKKKIIFGEPIDFRGLRFAPINEQGVVYLFGMISHELGFRIESIRTEYPDCEGKRCFDKINNQWEHINIEFEYRSKNFLEHGHNPDECDLIICWIHDWQDCPVEVLELKSTIKYL